MRLSPKKHTTNQASLVSFSFLLLSIFKDLQADSLLKDSRVFLSIFLILRPSSFFVYMKNGYMRRLYDVKKGNHEMGVYSMGALILLIFDNI